MAIPYLTFNSPPTEDRRSVHTCVRVGNKKYNHNYLKFE